MIVIDDDDMKTMIGFLLAAVFGAVGRAAVEKSDPSTPLADRLRGKLASALRRIVMAVSVGPIVGIAMRGSGFEPSWQFVSVAVSAVIADDLLMFVVNAGASISSKDSDLLGRLLTRFVGPKEPKE